MSYAPGDLFAAIGVAPALPGARCRGRHALFDEAGKDESPEVVQQRHTQALGLCAGCTALASCSAWFDTLPKEKRPLGVIAGKVQSTRPGA